MRAPFETIAAYIFDLDGLLVDSEPIWFQVEGGFLAELGFTWTREAANRCMGQGTPNTLRIWKETFGVDVDIERDTATIIDRMIGKAEAIMLQPGARELLERLHANQLPMAVASSSPRRLIEAVLDAKAVRQYFQVVVSAQEVPRTKPAPDVFLRAAELLRVEPHRCVVFEDAVAGAQAGRAAGCEVIAVPSVAPELFNSITPYVVKDLHKAQKLLFDDASALQPATDSGAGAQ